MGRGAVAQRVEQEAEALVGLLLGDADDPEHLALDLGRVDSDRAAAQLPAVHDEVIGARAQGAGVLEEGTQRGGVVGGKGAAVGCRGRGEGVVQRVPAPLGLAPPEHREVNDPADLVAVVRDQVVAPRQLEP